MVTCSSARGPVAQHVQVTRRKLCGSGLLGLVRSHSRNTYVLVMVCAKGLCDYVTKLAVLDCACLSSVEYSACVRRMGGALWSDERGGGTNG
jgi:hypothetical protein